MNPKPWTVREFSQHGDQDINHKYFALSRGFPGDVTRLHCSKPLEVFPQICFLRVRRQILYKEFPHQLGLRIKVIRVSPPLLSPGAFVTHLRQQK